MSTHGVPRSSAEVADRSGVEPTRSSSPSATVAEKPLLRVDDLGWTAEETVETRARLRPFEDDWNVPGMDAYDAL